MSQAENRNTTIPTRRALLAGAPAIAAAALAVGGITNVAACLAPASTADAELLALRDRFAPLFEEWGFGKTASFKSGARISEAIATRLGRRPNRDHNGDADLRDEAYWRTRSEVVDELRHDEEDDDLTDWDSLNADLYEVAEEILSHRATTREGLALQVQTFLTISGDRIFEDTDDRGAVYKFAMCVLGFTGAPFPTELISTKYGEPLAVQS